VVAVARNVEKGSAFSIEERLEMLDEVLGSEPAIRVTVFDGLVVDLAQKLGARSIIRGLRAMSDFEYEFEMALMNDALAAMDEKAATAAADAAGAPEPYEYWRHGSAPLGVRPAVYVAPQTHGSIGKNARNLIGAASVREVASVVGPLCTPLDLLADRMDLPAADVGDLVVVAHHRHGQWRCGGDHRLGHPAGEVGPLARIEDRRQACLGAAERLERDQYGRLHPESLWAGHPPESVGALGSPA
jgi:hypothetical protein